MPSRYALPAPHSTLHDQCRQGSSAFQPSNQGLIGTPGRISSGRSEGSLQCTGGARAAANCASIWRMRASRGSSFSSSPAQGKQTEASQAFILSKGRHAPAALPSGQQTQAGTSGRGSCCLYDPGTVPMRIHSSQAPALWIPRLTWLRLLLSRPCAPLQPSLRCNVLGAHELRQGTPQTGAESKDVNIWGNALGRHPVHGIQAG